MGRKQKGGKLEGYHVTCLFPQHGSPTAVEVQIESALEGLFRRSISSQSFQVCTTVLRRVMKYGFPYLAERRVREARPRTRVTTHRTITRGISMHINIHAQGHPQGHPRTSDLRIRLLTRKPFEMNPMTLERPPDTFR